MYYIIYNIWFQFFFFSTRCCILKILFYSSFKLQKTTCFPEPVAELFSFFNNEEPKVFKEPVLDRGLFLLCVSWIPKAMFGVSFQKFEFQTPAHTDNIPIPSSSPHNCTNMGLTCFGFTWLDFEWFTFCMWRFNFFLLSSPMHFINIVYFIQRVKRVYKKNLPYF